jgi:hypothetical protein
MVIPWASLATPQMPPGITTLRDRAPATMGGVAARSCMFNTHRSLRLAHGRGRHGRGRVEYRARLLGSGRAVHGADGPDQSVRATSAAPDEPRCSWASRALRMSGWIKVCGMTTAEAVTAAAEAGVDAIGFVFAPSPRRMKIERAAELALPVRQKLTCVAVMQHPAQSEVDEVVREFHPHLLQTDIEDFPRLHLPQRVSRLPVLRAARAAGGYPPRLLYEGARSGSGEVSDWQQAADPGSDGRPRSATRRGCRSAGARTCGSSARTWRTPARTRSTTRMGQALLARRLGAKRIVAETGAGQHGVASAAACARVGLPCTVYMGAVDMERQAPNVGRMRLLGATVVRVTSGDPHAARRHRRGDARLGQRPRPGTYYLLGSAVGRASVSVPGARAAGRHRPRGARADPGAGRRLPDVRGRLRRRRLQCHRPVPSLHRRSRRRDHRRRGGRRGAGLGDNAARSARRPGVLHGSYSMLLQDATARSRRRIRCRPGSTIPASVPSTRCCRPGRVRYEAATDEEALAAVRSAASARASCRRSKARTRWPARGAGRGRIRASAC